MAVEMAQHVCLTPGFRQTQTIASIGAGHLGQRHHTAPQRASAEFEWLAEQNDVGAESQHLLTNAPRADFPAHKFWPPRVQRAGLQLSQRRGAES
jgi:hypothetical protein